MRSRTQNPHPEHARARRIETGALGVGVFSFGLPMAVGMLLYAGFNLIDMFMLSRLQGASSILAALAICDMVFALAAILGTGIANGAVALVARRLGERDGDGLQRAAWQSLLLTGVISVLVGTFGVAFAPALTAWMGAKGAVAEHANAYLEIMLGGAFSILFLLQVTAILRALGHARSAAALLVAGNALNIVLNAVLIYGQGPHPAAFAWAHPIAEAFSVPRMGMVGCAWATLLGRAVPVVVGAAMLVAMRDGLRPRARFLKPDWGILGRIFRIGLPSCAQFASRIVVILVFVAIVAAKYTSEADATTLTAYSICLRLEMMVLFGALGWGAAASTYVGVNLGAGNVRRAARATWLAGAFAAGTSALMVGVAIGFASPILGFFDSDPAVVAAGERYLWLVAPSYLGLAVGVVVSQGMTGAGSTLSSFVLDAAITFVFVVPMALVTTGPLGVAPEGLWTLILVGNLVTAAAFAVYFARGAPLRKRV